MFLHKNKKDELTKRERRFLWSRIHEEIIQEGAGMSAPFWLSWFSPFRSTYKFAFASFLVIALVASSAATVSAADDATPGDTLFPLDIAIEKVQLTFSKGNKKSTLRIHFAEERLLEAKATVTPEDDTEAAEEGEGKLETTRFTRAEKALLVARNHLEKGRGELQKEGGTDAALIIDDIIAELDGLAELHVQKGRGRGGGGKSALAPGQLKKVSAEVGDGNEEGGGNESGDDDENDESENKNDEEGNENENNDAEGGDENSEEEDNGGGEDNNETENARGRGSKKVTLCHTPAGNPTAAHTILIGSPAARAHVAHGDTLGACDGENKNGEEDEDENNDEEEGGGDEETDTTAPTLSNISAASATTSADITWTTNEQATSKVWYQSTSPVIIDSASVADSDVLSESHSITLSPLTASTTYFYIVSSSDAAGNMATTSEFSFTTLP